MDTADLSEIAYSNLDLDNLPDFNCLCELCDCGCFEQSKQPHAITCKKLLNQQPNERQPNFFENKYRSNSSFDSDTKPKGFLSEYQYSFLNSKPEKVSKNKIKDSLSLFSIDGKPNEFIEDSRSSYSHLHVDPRKLPIRSKTLKRLNEMLPYSDKVSWYQSDYSFYGSDENLNGNQTTRNSTEENHKHISKNLDHYKNEYLRNFDEMNKGFVDNYSISKGGVLLSISNQNKLDDPYATKSNNSFGTNFSGDSYNKFNSQSAKIREHDFRSVWKPKKFDGRNMFASHIDSAIFPDKIDKAYQTQYNHHFESNPEKRVTFDKPPYEKTEKSITYAFNHNNQYVPSIRWSPVKDSFEKQREESDPLKTIYQASFEKPKSSLKKSMSMNKIQSHHHICKAAALQTLMRRDQRLAVKYGHKTNEALRILEKRKNEINQILLKS